MDEGGYFVHRLDHAGLVVGEHDRHEDDAVLFDVEHRTQHADVDDTRPVDRQLETSEVRHRSQHSWMLDCRATHEWSRSALADRVQGGASHGQVVRLGPAAREDEVAGLTAEHGS